MTTITRETVFKALVDKNEVDPHALIVGLVEKMLIEEALILFRGNQSATAERLNINRATLRKRLIQFSIKTETRTYNRRAKPAGGSDAN